VKWSALEHEIFNFLATLAHLSSRLTKLLRVDNDNNHILYWHEYMHICHSWT